MTFVQPPSSFSSRLLRTATAHSLPYLFVCVCVSRGRARIIWRDGKGKKSFLVILPSFWQADTLPPTPMDSSANQLTNSCRGGDNQMGVLHSFSFSTHPLCTCCLIDAHT